MKELIIHWGHSSRFYRVKVDTAQNLGQCIYLDIKIYIEMKKQSKAHSSSQTTETNGNTKGFNRSKNCTGERWGEEKLPKLKMKVKVVSRLPFYMFPLLFQDSQNHLVSEITVLTISVPTKAAEGALFATLSGERVILVIEISYFPGKKFKKLLRNHQQLVLTHCDVPWNMSSEAVVKNCCSGIASQSAMLSKSMNSC